MNILGQHLAGAGLITSRSTSIWVRNHKQTAQVLGCRQMPSVGCEAAFTWAAAEKLSNERRCEGNPDKSHVLSIMDQS